MNREAEITALKATSKESICPCCGAQGQGVNMMMDADRLIEKLVSVVEDAFAEIAGYKS